MFRSRSGRIRRLRSALAFGQLLTSAKMACIQLCGKASYTVAHERPQNRRDPPGTNGVRGLL
jgi:hypothetical protein